MAYCITKSYGLERIKATVPKWLAAMAKGRDAAPKCGAKTRAGTNCQIARMVGAKHCRHHVHGTQRDILDAQRGILAEKNARSTNARRRADGERTLAVIARRRLHRAWLLDPTISGSTLILSQTDEARVRTWLAEAHRIELDFTTHETGHAISCRCIDRLRWAGALFLTERITPDSAVRRVAAAMREDLKWWSKHQGEAQ